MSTAPVMTSAHREVWATARADQPPAPRLAASSSGCQAPTSAKPSQMAAVRPWAARSSASSASPIPRDSGEQLFDRRPQRALGDGADELPHELALPVHEVRLGQARHAELDGGAAARVAPVRVGHAELVEEGAGLVVAVPDVHADERHAARPVLLGEPLQHLGLLAAGLAPRGPEVY